MVTTSGPYCGRCGNENLDVKFNVEAAFEDRPGGGSYPVFKGAEVRCTRCGRTDPFTPEDLSTMILQALTLPTKSGLVYPPGVR